MNDTLRNVLGVIAGFFIGSVVNFAIVSIGPQLIPIPEGVDLSTPEGLQAAMPLLKPMNLLFPFLAHAGGTLVGAFLAAKIAATRKKEMALIIGILFLVGGLTAVYLYGGPTWFKIVDILFAYMPMAVLGWKLAGGNN